jgi:hypothetical protein
MRSILLLLGGLLLAACSGSDAQTLTSEGREAINRGDSKSALVKFEQALEGLDAKGSAYLSAALGRCEALARLDAKKASAEFLKLAKAETQRITSQDFHLIVGPMLTHGSRVEAVDVMHQGVQLYPDDPKMKEIRELVIEESTKAGDERAMKALEGLGYL